jgi:hypothetical protein
MYKDEIVLTAAEFALFFEGADFSKRFVDSPLEGRNNIKNKRFPMSQELQAATI